MCFPLLLLILPLPLLSDNSSAHVPGGLRMVHVVFRHGDRTPIDPYPTDPYKSESSWPVSLGQLTSRGKLQHQELGRWLRKRYSDFLSHDYSEKEVYIRSTDVDRTLMSAAANLQGLFPPEGYLKFDPALNWQPVPIHTVAQSEDYLLSSHANCPKFEELHAQVLEGQVMKTIYLENEEMFRYISKHTGLNLTDIVHLDYVYDSLLCEWIHNKTLPKWTEKVFPSTSPGPWASRFKGLTDLSFTVDTFTDSMKRLKGGPFLQLLVEHYTSLQKGEKVKKLYMYSGHDTTVAPILHTLGVFNGIAPPYASMIIFELFEGESLQVKVSYKNTTDIAFPLILPGCTELCPIDKFVALTSNMRPLNVQEECGLNPPSDPAVQRVTLLAALASTVMAATVLIAALLMLCKGRGTSSSAASSARYHPVGQNEDF